MKEIGTAEMSQTLMVTSDSEVSRRSTHSEPYLTKSEVRLRLSNLNKMPTNRPYQIFQTSRNAPDPGDTNHIGISILRLRMFFDQKKRRDKYHSNSACIAFLQWK